jgi:hypothetical protein
MNTELERPLVEEICAPEVVVQEFRVGWQAKKALAAIRQEKLNALAGVAEMPMQEGLGQLVTRIDPDIYWAAKQKFGADCWKDKGFRKDAERNGLIKRMRGINARRIIVPGASIGG